MRTLIFDRAQWEKLQKVCEAGYPKEVCGLFFGPAEGPARVTRVEVLENILSDQHVGRLRELMAAGAVPLPTERTGRGGAFEFVIDPRELYQKVLQAQKEGLDQVGLFHSHPDHPAKPSPTDASQPYLSGWSNVIAAVHQGEFKEARSWFRETEQAAFQEENILIE